MKEENYPYFQLRLETSLEITTINDDKVILTLDDARKLRWFLNCNNELLRPDKDWANCSYESHADDCDCRGAGGDR